MILLSKLPLYRPKQAIQIPPAGIDGKNICFAFFPENTNFLETYRTLNLRPQFMRLAFIPTTKRPVTRLTPKYMKLIRSHKLIPVKGYIGDYGNVMGKNFFLDLGTYLNASVSMWNLKNFNAGRGVAVVTSIINSVESIPSNMYERVCLYCVNIDEPIPNRVRKRRIWPIFKMIVAWSKGNLENLPFDKLLLHLRDHSSSRYILLFDKDQKANLGRILAILKRLKAVDEEENENLEIEDISDEVTKKSPNIISKSEEQKNKIRDNVKDLLKVEPSLSQEEEIERIDPDSLAASAVVYNITGDIDKAKAVSKQITSGKVKNKIVNSYIDDLLEKPKIKPAARNTIVKLSEPDKLVDNQIPSHILGKRENDFSKLLEKDLKSSFKFLETRKLPLKIVKVTKTPIIPPPSQLEPSLSNNYEIQLKDKYDKIQTVNIELPYLTKNGTFLLNGQEKILKNQIIPYPIIFRSPYLGKLSTNYAVLEIASRYTLKNPYITIYVSGYLLPISLIFAYRIGFNETLKLFKINYEMSEERVNENSFKLKNNSFITFKYDENNEAGKQMAQSFIKAFDNFPEKINLDEETFWRQEIVRQVGTRNCIYKINNTLNNIISPIEKEILKSKGDPTELIPVMKYICDGIVEGRVDDGNSIDRQRVRTSEIFIRIIQKQVLMAYNEYESKRLGGDVSAKLEIVPTKAKSDITSSQNVKPIENINPLKELSEMTIITPIGEGALQSTEAISEANRNIHHTYFGNIDPLETPDGENVGVSQHLTVGASLSSARGTFKTKDRSMVDPSEILSIGPAMIPFVGNNDGNRILMGCSQSKQALPLLETENPAIQTGYESLLTPLLSDNFIKKSPINGEISEISDSIIIIKGEDGKNYPVPISPVNLFGGTGLKGLSVFTPIVRVGQKVKKDQIIAEGANIKDGLISNGLNTLVAYMPWKGYNYEDGIVISESMAKRFTSVHSISEKSYLEEGEDVSVVVKIGDEVTKGTILLGYSTEIEDVEAIRYLRSTGEGIITNIEVFSNIDEIPEKLIDNYERTKKQYLLLKGKYPQGHFREKNDKFSGILVKFVIEERSPITLGDKMSNRHGGKGVVSLIEKDENMPLTPWGERVDVCFNPLGIINRMNIGQVLELHTGLISRTLSKEMESSSRAKFTGLYQRVLALLDGTKNKQLSRNIIGKIKSLSDSQYEKLKKEITSNKFVPLLFAPFKSPTKEEILQALEVMGLKPAYKLRLPVEKITTDPVAVGFVYMNKLEHLADKKLSSRATGKYMGKTLAPVRGKKRGGGQKMGEYDMYSLLSWNCPTVLEEMFGGLSSDHVTKNEMISNIVQTGETEFKHARTNPVRDVLTYMMMSLHLKAE